MAECCDNFGGRISIDIDGKKYGARGDITIEPTNIEVAGDANHDGSPYYVQKPRLFRASFKLSDPCGWIWNDNIRKCKINVTIREEDNDRTHLYTNARIEGKITVNISTGEVDGFAISGPQYQKF